MKKLFNTYITFVVAIAFCLLTACAGLQQSNVASTVTALAQARLADGLIQAGIVDDAVMSVDLSDAELDIYIAALDQYNDFREQWKQPSAEIYLLLDTQYAQIYASYKSVEAVVIAHWDDYSLAEQTQLRAYQSYARNIDIGATESLAAKNQQQALNNAIELGIMIAKIVAI